MLIGHSIQFAQFCIIIIILDICYRGSHFWILLAKYSQLGSREIFNIHMCIMYNKCVNENSTIYSVYLKIHSHICDICGKHIHYVNIQNADCTWYTYTAITLHRWPHIPHQIYSSSYPQNWQQPTWTRKFKIEYSNCWDFLCWALCDILYVLDYAKS